MPQALNKWVRTYRRPYIAKLVQIDGIDERFSNVSCGEALPHDVSKETRYMNEDAG